jgi:hypothetical protein
LESPLPRCRRSALDGLTRWLLNACARRKKLGSLGWGGWLHPPTPRAGCRGLYAGLISLASTKSRVFLKSGRNLRSGFAWPRKRQSPHEHPCGQWAASPPEPRGVYGVGAALLRGALRLEPAGPLSSLVPHQEGAVVGAQVLPNASPVPLPSTPVTREWRKEVSVVILGLVAASLYASAEAPTAAEYHAPAAP